MLRKIVIAAAFAVLAAATVASVATGRPRQESVSTSLLMPGVTYTREVDFSSRGPIVLDVVTAPKPDGKVYSLQPALSNGVLRGTEEPTHLQQRTAAGATTVAIDGDYFASRTGAPNGILMQGGVLGSAPAAGRSSLGIGSNGLLTTARVSLAGSAPFARVIFVPPGPVSVATAVEGRASRYESFSVSATPSAFGERTGNDGGATYTPL